MKIKNISKAGLIKIIFLLFFVLFASSASAYLSNETVVLSNYAVSSATGQSVFSMTSDITVASGGDLQIQITIPNEFTASDIDGTGDDHLWSHCSVDINGSASTLVQSDTETYLASNVLYLTTNSLGVNSGEEIVVTCDSTVIDLNPAMADVYTFNFELTDGSDTDNSTGSASLLIAPATGDIVASATLSTYEAQATAVTFNLKMRAGSEIPADGKLQIIFPAVFTMGDIADLTSHITVFTDEGVDISANISSATLTDNTIEIVVSSSIPASDEIEITFDNTVIDENPYSAGMYSVSLLTRDDEDGFLDDSYLYLLIDDQIIVASTIQETMIMTLDKMHVNLRVNPAVSDGEDYGQFTKINVKTNAKNGYKIQAYLDGGALVNADNYIYSGDAENNENMLGYVAYNGDVTKNITELKNDANPVATFASSIGGLNLYDGTANAIGLDSSTNSYYHTIYYVLNVDFNIPAGIYSGMIVYTVLPSF